MNLPDALIAHEGIFATHFLTVGHQDKSKFHSKCFRRLTHFGIYRTRNLGL
jgi:hypothetical protein